MTLSAGWYIVRLPLGGNTLTANQEIFLESSRVLGCFDSINQEDMI